MQTIRTRLEDIECLTMEDSDQTKEDLRYCLRHISIVVKELRDIVG